MRSACRRIRGDLGGRRADRAADEQLPCAAHRQHHGRAECQRHHLDQERPYGRDEEVPCRDVQRHVRGIGLHGVTQRHGREQERDDQPDHQRGDRRLPRVLPSRICRIIDVAGRGAQRNVERGDKEHHEYQPQLPRCADGAAVLVRDAEQRQVSDIAGDVDADRAERAERERQERKVRQQNREQHDYLAVVQVAGQHDQANEADHREHDRVDERRIKQRAHEAARAVSPLPGRGEHVVGIRGVLGEQIAEERADRGEQQRHEIRTGGDAGQDGLGLNAAHAAGSQRQREDRGENQIDESHHDADDDAADDAGPLEPDGELTREPVCAERGAENQRHAGKTDRHP